MQNIFCFLLLMAVFLFNACGKETNKEKFLRLYKEGAQCLGKEITERDKLLQDIVVANCNESELNYLIGISECSVNACKNGIRDETQLREKCPWSESKINSFGEKCQEAFGVNPVR